jgi:hypothetical protein
MEETIVCVEGEILPSEEMLEILKGGYVADLNQDLDVKTVQHGLIMEGLPCVKVTGMGDRQVFLQMKDGGLEAAIEQHKEWWG